MTAPGAPFLPDILEEHLEELPFLWDQWRDALRSPEYTLPELGDIERRIEAHVRALLRAGEQVIPLLAEGLQSDESALAAAVVLLRLDTEKAAATVLDALGDAVDEQLVGICEGLRYGPITRLRDELRRLMGSARAPTTSAVAQGLAFHAALDFDAEQLHGYLEHPDAVVRERGWRLVGYLCAKVEPKVYAAAMRDQEGSVRRAAIEAGAWCAVPGMLLLGRKFGDEPKPADLSALTILSILGGPDDLARMRAIGACSDLGPERFRLLGSYGSPAVMDQVLSGLRDDDADTAAAAAAAFTKMTGISIESEITKEVPVDRAAEPDEVEAEFVEEVPVPDAERAHREWSAMEPRLGLAPRICRGFDLAQGLDPDSFAKLDMESRWEVSLRSKFQGSWNGSPIGLERYPQRG